MPVRLRGWGPGLKPRLQAKARSTNARVRKTGCLYFHN